MKEQITIKQNDITKDHDRIMQELEKQFEPVLKYSRDGVYLWLDETHMICNRKLANMFGYTVEEIKTAPPFLDTFVAEQDQEMFSKNYHKSIAKLSAPVTFKFNAVRKDGKTFRVETDMIPITFQGHAIAYHFVREAEA